MPASMTTRPSLGLLLSASLGLLATGAVAPSPGQTLSPGSISGLSEPEAVYAAPVGSASASALPTAAVAGRSYRFSTVLDGQPVRWDPCAPIHWTSSTGRGPAGGLVVLRSAVAQVARATGTTWVYDGERRTVPSSAYLPREPARSYPPVLLGWTDGTASDLLRAAPPGVLGMTRTSWFGAVAAGRRAAATRAGVVALDRTDRLALSGPVSWAATTLHELGHVMGLQHSLDTQQLMAPLLPRSVAGLQPGDRAGLALLGRSRGCVDVRGV